MSEDLISRKALLKELKEYVEGVYECDFGDTFCTAEGGSTNPKYVQGLWEAKEIIEGHPIAYDVDKVVERLEERKADREKEYKTASLQDGSYMLSMVFRESAKAYERAIEIVEGGGVDE